MLDAHREFAVPDESYFPVWLGRVRGRYERPEGFALERLIDDLLAHESFGRWGLDGAEVAEALRAAGPATFPDAVRAYYAAYARAHGKPRYADKTPIFALHIPLLAAMFPEAVFVHVVRDGRDVVLSRMEASWGSKQLEHETLQWRSHIRTARLDGSALGAARYCEIRYEELVDRTEEIARRLCRFIGAEFDPAMLSYYERSQALVAAMVYPEEHGNLMRPPTKGLRNWREQLVGPQLALFEALAGDTLRLFGYECASGAPAATVRARALQARSRYAASLQYRRARGAAWRVLHPGSAA